MTATDFRVTERETRRVPEFTTTCSRIVVALMVVESLLGLLVHGLYEEETWAVAALRGNDLVTLFLVVPALSLAITRSSRSYRWTLVWLAGLFYGIYNFAYYAFGTTFNRVFLLHVATLAMSIAALVTFVMGFRPEPAPPPRQRHRTVAGFMVLVGAALLTAWGGMSLRYAVTGDLPHDVMPPSAVHLVYALDMSLLAPAFLAAGVLLWRHRPWGYVLGVAVNLFGAAYLTVLEFVGGFEANAGIAGTSWASPPAILGALLCATSATVLLRDLPERTTTS